MKEEGTQLQALAATTDVSARLGDSPKERGTRKHSPLVPVLRIDGEEVTRHDDAETGDDDEDGVDRDVHSCRHDDLERPVPRRPPVSPQERPLPPTQVERLRPPVPLPHFHFVVLWTETDVSSKDSTE